MPIMKEGLTPGIDAYCDRWCERCVLWNQCRVGLAERGAGSRAQDPGQFIEEVMRHLQEALELAARECKRLGIDPEAVAAEEVPDTSDHPLLVRAVEWCKRTGRWLAASELPSDLAPPSPSEARAECRGVVSWYRTLAPAKVGRALSSRALHDTEGEEGAPPAASSDADGSAKVAWLGLLQVIDSLTRSYDAVGGHAGTLDGRHFGVLQARHRDALRLLLQRAEVEEHA